MRGDPLPLAGKLCCAEKRLVTPSMHRTDTLAGARRMQLDERKETYQIAIAILLSGRYVWRRLKGRGDLSARRVAVNYKVDCQ